MNSSNTSLIAAVQNTFDLNVGFTGTKKPGGQTSKNLFDKLQTMSVSYLNGRSESKTGMLSDGFVLDGYFLGTFEFDSLTGHPGIRY